jgi:hypothetical protein
MPWGLEELKNNLAGLKETTVRLSFAVDSVWAAISDLITPLFFFHSLRESSFTFQAGMIREDPLPSAAATNEEIHDATEKDSAVLFAFIIVNDKVCSKKW